MHMCECLSNGEMMYLNLTTAPSLQIFKIVYQGTIPVAEAKGSTREATKPSREAPLFTAARRCHD